MSYDGFSLACGCPCRGCGGPTRLEGYNDANGTHYCPVCDDYVPTAGPCPQRAPARVLARQAMIAEGSHEPGS